MYKCYKCEGFVEELGELEPSDPCTCEVDKIKALERQLAEAREEIESYKYDLNTLVDTVSDCVNKWSWEDAFRTLKEIDSHYKQLKEQD